MHAVEFQFLLQNSFRNCYKLENWGRSTNLLVFFGLIYQNNSEIIENEIFRSLHKYRTLNESYKKIKLGVVTGESATTQASSGEKELALIVGP